jgi:hypothetical protein
MKVNITKYPKDPSKQRKINIKIDKYDLWDFRSSVGLVILEWLKEFRKYDKHGVPGDMNHFTQVHESYSQQGAFDFYIKDNPPFENAEIEWHAILDKMIWSFDEIINETNADCYWIVKPEADWDNPNDEPNSNGFYEMRWKVEGKMDRNIMREYGERIQEGLDLFAKHCVNLWD